MQHILGLCTRDILQTPSALYRKSGSGPRLGLRVRVRVRARDQFFVIMHAHFAHQHKPQNRK